MSHQPTYPRVVSSQPPQDTVIHPRVADWHHDRITELASTGYAGWLVFRHLAPIVVHPAVYERIAQGLEERSPSWFFESENGQRRVNLLFAVENHAPGSYQLLREVNDTVRAMIGGLTTERLDIVPAQMR